MLFKLFLLEILYNYRDSSVYDSIDGQKIRKLFFIPSAARTLYTGCNDGFDLLNCIIKTMNIDDRL